MAAPTIDLWIIFAVAMMFLFVIVVGAVLIFGKRGGMNRGRVFKDWIYGREGRFIKLGNAYDPGCKDVYFKPAGSLFGVEVIKNVPTTGYKTIDPFDEKCPQEGFFILFNDGKQHMEPTLFDHIGGEKTRELSQTIYDERKRSHVKLAAERTAQGLMDRGSDEKLKKTKNLLDELERRREKAKKKDKRFTSTMED